MLRGGDIAAHPATFEGVEVTDEMAEHVAVYVNVCRALMGRAERHWIEYRFNLAAFHPPAPMFGTADFAAYHDRSLTVVDLKYGQGVVVEVEGNKQLMYYALGAALSVGLPVDYVNMVVVQPRAEHADGPVRQHIVSLEDLIAFSAELMEAAALTQTSDAPLHPGAHCRFCPASGVCPAQLDAAQLVAQTDFDVMPATLPPVPATLDDATFAEMMSKLHILDDWSKAMRAHATSKLARGETVPGFKLVARRATRKWVNHDAADDWLLDAGYVAEQVYEPETLRSVAQIERLVGKKMLPAHLHESKSGGYTLAPATDRRPALAAAPGDDFALLTAGEDE